MKTNSAEEPRSRLDVDGCFDNSGHPDIPGRRPQDKQMANDRNHGGARPGSGRPVGAKDRLPRKKKYDEFRQMVYDVELHEYLITNEDKVFAGNALELMVAIYKAENLPVKTRLYAASKAVEFEPRVADQLVTSTEDSQNTQWLVDQLDRMERAKAHKETPIGELLPPPQPKVHARKREPVTIDGNGYGCNHLNSEDVKETADEPRIEYPPSDVCSRNSGSKRGSPNLGNQAAIIVYAQPHENFWIGGRGMVSADANGEVRCDSEAIAATLVAAGCKRVA